MKWIFTIIGFYIVYKVIKGAAPPSWPTDIEAEEILRKEKGKSGTLD